MDFNLLKTIYEFLVSGDHPAVSALLFVVAVLAYVCNYLWNKYDKLTAEYQSLRDEANKQIIELNAAYNDARTKATEQTVELNSLLKELQESYSQSNNNTADVVKKLAETVSAIIQTWNKN